MSAKLNLSKFELMWLFEGAAGKSHLRWDIYRIFIEKVFPQLDDNEREFLYTYIKRDTAWLWEGKYRDETPYQYWRQVLARFNPANQYIVTAQDGDKKECKEAYQYDGKYYVGMNNYFAQEYITSIERKPYKKCANDTCAARNECLRYTERNDGDPTLTNEPYPCAKCDLFIDEK